MIGNCASVSMRSKQCPAMRAICDRHKLPTPLKRRLEPVRARLLLCDLAAASWLALASRRSTVAGSISLDTADSSRSMRAAGLAMQYIVANPAWISAETCQGGRNRRSSSRNQFGLVGIRQIVEPVRSRIGHDRRAGRLSKPAMSGRSVWLTKNEESSDLGIFSH